MKISAIILAAGMSMRLGTLKQLLPLGQSTLIEKTVAHVLASIVDETIVVLGHQADKIIPKIEWAPIKIVVNPNYQDGMSTSIIGGMMAMKAGAEAVMLILGDQPFIQSRTINRILDKFIKHGKGIAVPVYRGQWGHPVIISLKYKAELMALKGDIGARGIISRYSTDVLRVRVRSAGVIKDIDTEQDYESIAY